MKKNTPSIINNLTQKFKKWRKDNFTADDLYNNTTDDYKCPFWIDIEKSLTDIFETDSFLTLSLNEKENIIYLIARNECRETIIPYANAKFSRVGLKEEQFIDLIELAIESYEEPAKYQFADKIPLLKQSSIEKKYSWLFRLYHSGESFTKSTCLHALQKLNYPDIVEFVFESWYHIQDNQFHQITCLEVLENLNNGRMAYYLENLKLYPDWPYLNDKVKQIQAKIKQNSK